MDGDEMTQSNPSVVATDIPPVDPFTPGEPYFAPRYMLPLYGDSDPSVCFT